MSQTNDQKALSDRVASIIEAYVPVGSENRAWVYAQLSMLSSVDEVFDRYKSTRLVLSDRVDHSFDDRIDEGKRRWAALRKELSEAEIRSLDGSLEDLLQPLYARSLAEVVASRVQEARKEMILAQPAETQALRRKAEAMSTKRSVLQKLNLAYLGAVVLIVGLVGLAIWRGWAQKAEVHVDFNVGEIIGGVLVGVGAAAAGTAYAIRTLGTTPPGENQ